jgi:hypothetical protein
LQLLDDLPRGVEEPSMGRFEVRTATAVREGGHPMPEMRDLKRTVRDTEADVKEAWRKADGDESLGDKAADAGDRLRNVIENAGDELHGTADEVARDVADERGRIDERNVPH